MTSEASLNEVSANEVSFNEELGSASYYSFQDFTLFGDPADASVQVNVGTGNLFVRTRVTSLAAPGVPATIYNTYNSNTDTNPTGSLGNWLLDTDNLGLSVSGPEYATLFDGTGHSGTFIGPALTPSSGLNAKLVRNGDGTWTVTYNKSGEQLLFSSQGWILKRVDRNGVGITYGYSNNRLASITDATGKNITLAYLSATTPGAMVSTISDSSGRAVNFTTDAYNRLLSTSDGWSMTYFPDGLHLKTLSRGGKNMAFEYDTRYRVTKTTQTVDGSTQALVHQFTYAAGETTVTDARGHDSTFTIDDQWRVTSATDQLNRVRSQTWTTNSDVETITDATGSGNKITTTYDTLNNATGTTLPTGAGTQAIYAQGVNCLTAQTGHPYLPKCTIDDAKNSRSMTYDTAGNLTKTVDTTGGGGSVTLSYTYDSPAGTLCGGKAGQICTATDGKGSITKYTYSNGNLTKVTPPAPLGATLYEYDAAGRATKVTDGNGKATVYGYNIDDQVISVTYANGQKVTTAYNVDGTVQSETDSGNGTTMTYKYNIIRGQKEKNVQGPTGSGIGGLILSSYDANGNLVSFDNGSGAASYGYDEANQLRTYKEPGGTCPTTGAPAAGSGCVVFDYDDTGNEIARIFPGGARQDTVRDNSGRPTRLTGKDANNTVRTDIGYTYGANSGTTLADDRKNIQTRISYKEAGIPAGATTIYTYNTRNQLTKAEEKAGATLNASWAYAYDGAGNRTSQIRTGNTGAPAGTITYQYNAANQITSTTADTTTWTYDAAGNQTRNGTTGATATYGDRLQVTANGSRAYVTFGQGNTEQLKAGSDTYLTSNHGLTSTTSGTTTVNLTRTSDGDALGYRGPGTDHYFVTDHLGTVVAAFSETGTYEGGYSYSPYGEARTAPGSALSLNSQRYIGGYYEASTGMYKLGARYYDPTLGRFSQMDPSGQESNPYAYAGCNPINSKDPSGLLTGLGALGACAIGALDGLIAGFVLGLASAGTGFAIAAVSGCVGNVVSQVVIEELGSQHGPAMDYLEFLGFLNEVVKRLR